MSGRISSKDFLAFTVYISAWLTPGCWLVLVDADLESIAKLLLSIAFFIVWHLAFKNVLQAMYCSLFFFALLPFDLFFYAIYHEPPTTPVLFSVANTNLAEAAGFMQGRVPLLLALVGACILVWLQAVRAAQRGAWSGLRCFHPVVRRACGSLLVMLVGALALYAFGPSLTHRLPQSAPGPQVVDLWRMDERLSSVVIRFRALFPVGRFVSLGEYHRDKLKFTYAQQRRELLRFHARQGSEPTERQIYVLVIGETARAAHSQLHGYARETSPYLVKRSNLVPFRDMLSPWSVTSRSVPTILTGHQSSAGDKQLKSIISAFREAGFKTYWLSNQQHEEGIAYFSREAHEVVHLSVSGLVMERGGNYDERLLGPLEKMLDRGEPRQFFVVHLLGSHDPYQMRYPAAFDFFQPSLTGRDGLDHHDVRNKVEVVNAYDNAMRYTDYVLSRIIDAVDRRRGISALVYSADHGETLFDGACPRSGHGSSSRNEFPVQAFGWVSDGHKRRWPDKHRLLKERGDAPLTTEFIFESMLGLADMTIHQGSPQHNVVGIGFEPQERWVNGQEPINWERAGTKGVCSLLDNEASP